MASLQSAAGAWGLPWLPLAQILLQFRKLSLAIQRSLILAKPYWAKVKTRANARMKIRG
jgi:hypothetical protein